MTAHVLIFDNRTNLKQDVGRTSSYVFPKLRGLCCFAYAFVFCLSLTNRGALPCDRLLTRALRTTSAILYQEMALCDHVKATAEDHSLYSPPVLPYCLLLTSRGALPFNRSLTRPLRTTPAILYRAMAMCAHANANAKAHALYGVPVLLSVFVGLIACHLRAADVAI